MTELLHDLVRDAARRTPSLTALTYREQSLGYGDLWEQVEQASGGFARLGLRRGDRLGIYLEKRFETVIATFGAAAAGGVFVPINPVLKPRQVGYIMRDCNIRVLTTSRQRGIDLAGEIAQCPDLAHIVSVDGGD